jgi:glycosyltransferase involved in cell wall biosynthesis
MRILLVSCGFPYPLDGGGPNIIYHWLEAASTTHDAHLLVISEQSNVPESIPGLPRLKIHSSQIQISRTLWGRARRQAASLFRSTPATSLVLMSPAVQHHLKDLLNRYHFDLIILAENIVAGFAPLLRSSSPVLLLKLFVDASEAKDHRMRHGRFHPRWMLEEYLSGRFEANTCRAASMVCCVTQQDVERLISRYRLSTPVVPIPLGVDLNRFPCRGNVPATQVIGFIGGLTWGGNVDAMHWLCREVLPRVWRTHPDAKLLAVGPGGESFRSLYADSRIHFAGRVPSIPEAMKEVSVGVVPIVSGTGMRTKLLDMLSMGIPTVSTSLGAEGLSYLQGEHFLIADSGETFANSLCTLLSDDDLRRRLAASGRLLASAYSWEKIYPKILEVFDLAFRQYHQNTINVRGAQAWSYATSGGAGKSGPP